MQGCFYRFWSILGNYVFRKFIGFPLIPLKNAE